MAENWENRNVLFDGESKNSCNVDMDYISNLLFMYIFHRGRGAYNFKYSALKLDPGTQGTFKAPGPFVGIGLVWGKIAVAVFTKMTFHRLEEFPPLS